MLQKNTRNKTDSYPILLDYMLQKNTRNKTDSYPILLDYMLQKITRKKTLLFEGSVVESGDILLITIFFFSLGSLDVFLGYVSGDYESFIFVNCDH